MEQYSARRMSSIAPLRSGASARLGPGRMAEAATRSALRADRQRENTASPISVTGMPRSRALRHVHLPVPFCPAVSRILSTSGDPSSSFLLKIWLVISIR